MRSPWELRLTLHAVGLGGAQQHNLREQHGHNRLRVDEGGVACKGGGERWRRSGEWSVEGSHQACRHHRPCKGKPSAVDYARLKLLNHNQARQKAWQIKVSRAQAGAGQTALSSHPDSSGRPR